MKLKIFNRKFQVKTRNFIEKIQILMENRWKIKILKIRFDSAIRPYKYIAKKPKFGRNRSLTKNYFCQNAKISMIFVRQI